MRERLERRIAVIFGCTLTVFFLIGVIQTQTVFKLVGAEHQVGHTHEVLEQLEATQSMLNDAEAGVRGYVIAGDESYLKSYDTAVSLVPSQLRDLRGLTADNPKQQKRLDALAALVTSRFADLQKIVDARRQEGTAAASQLVETGSTLKVTDDIHRTTDEIRDEEHQVLSQRNTAARVIAWEATLFTTVGAAVGFWLLILAGLLIYHYIRERKRAGVAHALSTQLLKGMAGGVSLSDDIGMILYVNPAVEALYGYRPGELIGENITALSDHSAPEDKLQVFDDIRQHLETEGIWRGDLAARKKDDTPFTCCLRVSPLEVSGKIYWICVHEDAAEHGHAPAR